MWRRLWQTWTIDKPAALGDCLWDIFVVQFAAWLDRLTLRQIIAFIPVVILVLAYAHGIPIPPELMLVGDVMAYLDIFSALVLLGILSRVETIMFVLTQVAGQTGKLMIAVRDAVHRCGVRHRRAAGPKNRQGSIHSGNADDDRDAAIGAIAWA